jgi:hypothetical protein
MSGFGSCLPDARVRCYVLDSREAAVFPEVHGPQPGDGAALLCSRARRPGERGERRWTLGGNRFPVRSVQEVLFPLLWRLAIARRAVRTRL